MDIGRKLIVVYQLFLKTPENEKGSHFMNEVLEILESCLPCADKSMCIFINAAKDELWELHTLACDKRPHPELVELFPYAPKEIIDVVLSFVTADDEFISNGLEFVLATFISPTARFLFDFEAKILEISLMSWMHHNGYFERDPFASIIQVEEVEAGEGSDVLMEAEDSDEVMEEAGE